jgi:hypothetical protein
MRKIAMVFSLLILSACSMSPVQFHFMKDIGFQDDGYIVMSADEVRAKLERYGDVTVGEGIYKVPKPGDMPIGPWCGSASDFKKDDWVCTHYANWAAEEMSGFAFGVARDGNHRFNVHLVDDNSRIKVAHYDPQQCVWISSSIEQVVILPALKYASYSPADYLVTTQFQGFSLTPQWGMEQHLP